MWIGSKGEELFNGEPLQVKREKEEDKLPSIMRKLDAICEVRMR